MLASAPRAKAKGADPNRASRGVTYPSEIIPEWRAKSGPWGYAEYLEAMADPKHERRAEMVEWRGPDFDPNAFDEAVIQERRDRLAPRRKTKSTQVHSLRPAPVHSPPLVSRLIGTRLRSRRAERPNRTLSSQT
jgi:hypothetical protein